MNSLRIALLWFRRIFLVWTRRYINIAPGISLEVPRGMSEREVRRHVHNFVYGRGKRE